MSINLDELPLLKESETSLDKLPTLKEKRRSFQTNLGSKLDNLPLMKAPPSQTVQAEEKENLLFKTLHNVNRLQYGVANTIYQAVINDDYDVAKSYWDGLSLKEKKSIGNTLSEIIQPESKFGKIAVGVTGFVGDVLTDPLTYVGAGLLTKSGKLAKSGSTTEKMIKAGRSAGKAKDTKSVLTFAGKKIPGSDIIAEPLSRGRSKTGNIIREDLRGVSEVIDKLKYISPKMRPKGVDPIVWQKFITASEKARNARKSLESTSLTKSGDIYKNLKDEGLDDNAIETLVNALETKGNITSKGGKIARGFSSELQNKYKKVGATGKQIIKEDGYEYLPHVSLKKNKKIQNAIGINLREFTTKSPGDIKRTILKYTDKSGKEFVMSTKNGKVFQGGKQINKFDKNKIEDLQKSGKLSQASIREINKAYGEPLFSTKLPELIAIQGMRTAKVVGGDTLFKNVRKFGSKMPKTERGVAHLESEAPDLAGLYFHPEITKHIDETYKKLVDSDEVSKVIETYDKVQNIWKTSATFWNIPFHTRNAISNMWQNSLAGVNSLTHYKDATRIQRGKSLSPSDTAILKEYRKQGLDKVGHLSGDIEQSIQSQIMSTMDLLKDKKPGQVLNKVSGKIGDFVETNAKLAHFIAKKKEGMSAFDAGQSVKKYLFDYEDLTRLEKDLFKRIFPFYTFTRKNMPLQFEALLKNPSRQTKLIKAKNNIEILTGDDNTTGILPEWLKDAAPIYVGKKDGKVRYIKLEGFLPVADLNKMSDPAKALLQMASPVLKAPVEQALNYNFFFGKPITKQKGKEGFIGYGERDLLWGSVPGRIEHLSRLFRPLNEIDKIFGRKYAKTTTAEKFINVSLGGKMYPLDTVELLLKYKKLNQDEVSAIKSQINYLKKQINNNPSKKQSYIDDIKVLIPILKQKQIKMNKNMKRAVRSLGYAN